MPRTRSMSRGKQKSSAKNGRSKRASTSKSAQNKRQNASETVNINVVTPQKHWSPDSETSPFKGFKSPVKDKENVKATKLFGDSSSDDGKDCAFDKLLDPPLRSHFLNKNVKTYSNKKKAERENYLLQFRDCKNRDNIIQWLNDNRNIFDRFSQTQYDPVDEQDDGTPLTLDMPSVSQANMTRSRGKTVRKTQRSPYKLRARSLNIQIKKNSRKGRSTRHSLAGDTPSMENYRIEEIITDEEAPVPAEKDVKLIVDLMEDEYLNTVEKEMLQTDEVDKEKSNQSSRGWKRIKDINKTINGGMKKPKQLNIKIQDSPSKQGNDMQHKTYDLNELEDYFIEKMEHLMRNKEYLSCSSQQITQAETVPLQDVVKAGINFIDILNKLVHNKDRRDISHLQAIATEIKNMFTILEVATNSTADAATQTTTVKNSNKQTQCHITVINVETQTEILYHCPNCANNNNNVIKSKISQCDKVVQAEQEKVSIEIQTDLLSRNNSHGCAKSLVIGVQQNVPQTSGTTTPSDIFDLNDVEKCISASESDFNINQKPEQTLIAEVNCTLNHTLDDFNFDTEDAFQEEIKQSANVIKEEDEVLDADANVPKSVECVLISSATLKSEGTSNKGVKRTLCPLNELQESRTKRPCNKFIKDDLSVAFDSCADHRTQHEDIIQLSDEDTDDEKYLDEVMNRYDSVANRTEIESQPEANKTQKDIEELEEKIRNATKPNRVITTNHQSGQSTNSDDCIFIEAEKKMSVLEKDLDYFNPHCSVLNGEETPKKIKRRLFNSQDEKKATVSKFSESLFDNSHNETVVENAANQTITQDNVDALAKEINRDSDSEADKEVQNITNESRKINILQNIVLKRDDLMMNDDDNEHTEDFLLSGVDVVESTPQKKYSTLSQQRSDSFLDVTLPPPLEFQDVMMVDVSQKMMTPEPAVPSTNPTPIPVRRPLAVVNKITSTPITQKHASERISLSPISVENSRVPGFIELAQQSKFSPLTIVRTTPSRKNVHLSGTPKQRSILNYVRPSQESRESAPSPTQRNKPCVSCSRISREQVMAISTMANRKLITYSSSFSSGVTHMIVSVNGVSCIKDHTIKSVSAIAAGIWVLSFGWVQECLAKNAIVAEEPYEALDVSGTPGPRKSRLTKKTNPLLKGFKIYVSPPFLTTTLQDIQNIVKMLGGTIAASPEELLDKGNYVCLIITEGKATQDCDSEKFETWLEALRVVTVDLEWLSRSVGQFQLQSLLPFTLCSDDIIDTLGYPPELLSSAPVSFLQSTSSR